MAKSPFERSNTAGSRVPRKSGAPAKGYAPPPEKLVTEDEVKVEVKKPSTKRKAPAKKKATTDGA